MRKDERGLWTPRRDHTYYYEAQVQLNLCEVEGGDFVVWTEGGIVVEAIFIDKSFMMQKSLKLDTSYRVLPEIIGKSYTCKAVVDESGVVLLLVIETSAKETDGTEILQNCGVIAVS